MQDNLNLGQNLLEKAKLLNFQAWHIDDLCKKIIKLQLACQSLDMAAGEGGSSPL